MNTFSVQHHIVAVKKASLVIRDQTISLGHIVTEIIGMSLTFQKIRLHSNNTIIHTNVIIYYIII